MRGVAEGINRALAWFGHAVETIRNAARCTRTDALNRFGQARVELGMGVVLVMLAVVVVSAAFVVYVRTGYPWGADVDAIIVSPSIAAAQDAHAVLVAKHETAIRLAAAGAQWPRDGFLWLLITQGEPLCVGVIFVGASVLAGILAAIGWHATRFFCGGLVMLIAEIALALYTAIWMVACFAWMLRYANARVAMEALATLPSDGFRVHPGSGRGRRGGLIV